MHKGEVIRITGWLSQLPVSNKVIHEVLALILFLDFDGVLHPIGGKTEPFYCVPELWRILRACPEVQVVFSTSWRESYPFDYLVDFATSNGGEDLDHRFIGSTPILPESHAVTRLTECEAWLVENGHTETAWLAIDDDVEAFRLCPHVVLTDRHTGLQEHHAEEIIRRIRSLQP